MRVNRFLATTLLLTACISSYAQYYDEYGNYHQTSRINNYRYTDDYADGWSNFYVEYSPLSMTSTDKDVKDRTFQTFTIGYTYDYGLGDLPLYLEAGFEASASFFSRRYKQPIDDVKKYSMNAYFCKVPVNFVYRINVAEGFAVIPFAGAYVRYNIAAEDRYKFTDGSSETYNIFDSDYTYDDDYNRFQVGYQGGLKLIIGNSFSVGAAWKADLTSFCTYADERDREQKEKFQGFAFTLGYSF